MFVLGAKPRELLTCGACVLSFGIARRIEAVELALRIPSTVLLLNSCLYEVRSFLTCVFFLRSSPLVTTKTTEPEPPSNHLAFSNE